MRLTISAPGSLEGWGLNYLLLNDQFQAIAAFAKKEDADTFAALFKPRVAAKNGNGKH